jgi:tetratricopeptide (TPR) repeat protein
MKIPFLLFMALLLGEAVADTNLDEGTGLYRKGEFKKSVEVLEKLASSSPAETDAKLWLGKAYLKTRDWDKAVREMEKVVELQPSNARYHLWLGRACGAKASHIFKPLALGWAKRVVKEFETARRLAPKDLDIRFDLLEFYMEAPGALGGGKEKAEAEAKEIAKLNPSKGYTARAIIFQKNKNWEQAKKEFTQATVEYPVSDSFKDLAGFLFERKDYKGALESAQKALELKSNSKGAQLLAAASRIKLKSDLDYALRILQALAEGPLDDNDPVFEEVHYWLGECCLEKADKENARKAFKAALAFNPDHDEAKKALSKAK